MERRRGDDAQQGGPGCTLRDVSTPLQPSARAVAGDARRRLGNVLYAIAGVAFMAALYLVWAYDPSTAGFFPSCPIHALTGYNCPGCGATRATHALLHGDVAAAFAFNPLYVVAIPCVAAWYLLRGQRRLSPPAVYALLAVVVSYGVLRNLVHV